MDTDNIDSSDSGEKPTLRQFLRRCPNLDAPLRAGWTDPREGECLQAGADSAAGGTVKAGAAVGDTALGEPGNVGRDVAGASFLTVSDSREAALERLVESVGRTPIASERWSKDGRLRQAFALRDVPASKLALSSLPLAVEDTLGSPLADVEKDLRTTLSRFVEEDLCGPGYRTDLEVQPDEELACDGQSDASLPDWPATEVPENGLGAFVAAEENREEVDRLRTVASPGQQEKIETMLTILRYEPFIPRAKAKEETADRLNVSVNAIDVAFHRLRKRIKAG